MGGSRKWAGQAGGLRLNMVLSFFPSLPISTHEIPGFVIPRSSCRGIVLCTGSRYLRLRLPFSCLIRRVHKASSNGHRHGQSDGHKVAYSIHGPLFKLAKTGNDIRLSRVGVPDVIHGL